MELVAASAPLPANSQEPVFTFEGVGLQVDGRKQTYLLESRASAVIESKHARKQP